ncbi:CMGC family protein kinase [Trichomonas vaginalis G3]|uniref:Cyclin-dependent kinase 2 n=1 Tax=Trichomonas vaginalis (strain ATCC PRA-98 / G3) TaxID=412133 RepID=A2DGG9_TRIV3|nr:STKc CDK like domain-containing protein [Trichomonas vaginalis G3]EAY20565.1 CMGC family protein kinase [Trichomonas vaginalis G3]KAI5488240.1 STKc CDK like domain-containing protein [Trichomonas vaginalis G3]|eukprot:XP_001581551.1 CMGC family protein kinase [Trichomonas vaginalis G3]
MDPRLRYIKQEKLGAGTYGMVFKAKDKTTGKIVAIKEMILDQEEEGVSSTTMREISILKKMNHPNIVSLVDTYVQGTQLTIVLEYLDMNIRDYMKKPVKMDPKLVKSYAFQLLAGTYYLHTHRVIHRDIKPDNLLINHDGYLKICDFGLSRFFTIPIQQYTENIVTLWYRPPEILLHNPIYEISADIWSVGCVIAEIATKTPLFPGDSILDQIHRIFSVLGTPNEEMCKFFKDVKDELVIIPTYPPKDLSDVIKVNDLSLIDLISKLINIDPCKRLTAREALHHPYFNDIPESMKSKFCPGEF